MTPKEIQNRYVELGNTIARLAHEAAQLEVAMYAGKHCPMTLNVYNGLLDAHTGVLRALDTISKVTGYPANLVAFGEPVHSLREPCNDPWDETF